MESLKKNPEFRNVYRRGKSYPSDLLILYKFRNYGNILEDGTPFNRIGVSVSKKVGKSVVRSRVKRLVLESVRLSRNEIISGYDFVFVARNPIAGKTFHEVDKCIKYLYKKAGLNKDEKNNTGND